MKSEKKNSLDPDQPKIKMTVSYFKVYPFQQVRENSTITFGVMLFTDKTTSKVSK